MTLFETITTVAEAESPVWAASLAAAPEPQPVFSPLVPEPLALGVETVYEAYLVHYGRPRLFSAADADEAVLLGDYLYAHGLVRIAEAGGVPAVAVMADLIARCAALRADGADGDGEAWVRAARALGGTPADDAVARALEAHSARVAA
ncbi:MAG TPA: hypothetical protein VGC78_12720 [Gaiellaceae bacterium]